MERRSFLIGSVTALITAPSIVRASSLMQVKQMIDDGIALNSMAHPYSWNNMVAADLSESSLLELLVELKKPLSGLIYTRV